MKGLLGTVVLIGGGLLLTLGISTVLDAWLLRPRITVAAIDDFAATSPLAAAISPAASPVTRARGPGLR
jgi:hypothetical protein